MNIYQHKRNLILASTSPRRIELMKRLHIPFEAHAPEFDEISSLQLSPEEEVSFFAREKALSLKNRFPQSILIGSDTLVALNQEKLGKPKGADAAREMLRKLSGKTHRVLTGVAVLDASNDRWEEFIAEAKVTFKSLSETDIANYILSGEPFDKAGAYAIQGLGAKYIDALEGDVETVIGLPVRELAERLRSFFFVG